jgi:signal peptidase I
MYNLSGMASRLVTSVATGCIAGQFIYDNIFQFTMFAGNSMLPTIVPAESAINVVVGAREPRIGDVIIARLPTSFSETMCKRVVGLPGDTVLAPSSSVVGAPLRPQRVPAGHVWVEGDNKPESCDSRYFGPLPIGMIVSRVSLVVWPPKAVRFVSRDMPQ